MKAYLRLFALASLVTALLSAGLIGLYFRSQVGTSLQALAAARQADQTQFFTEVLWQKYGAALQHGDALPAFRQEATGFMQRFSLAAARLYTPQGLLLWGTGGTLSAEQFARAPAQGAVLLSASEAGVPEVNPGATLLRGVLPVAPPGQPPQAYLELYSDLSPQWHKLALQQWIASGGVMMVFIVLIWMLVITSRKAEVIIARQHEANVELAAAAAAAQAENQEKSLFLANVSHELRTPLNAIIGFSEIIKDQMLGEIKNTAYQGYITDIYNSGVHLLALINDILDFSKAASGKLELEVEEVNATKMVANCLRLVSPRAENGNVELINAMPKDPFVLETDAKKFKQIMLNLLSNAVKFTPATGRVRVSGWRDLTDDAFMFEVADTGIGIAPKDIAKAMAPFGQVDNALSRKYEGTGLGLPLTRKFVEALGGKFSIKSELNAGTVITFSLPRVFRAKEGITVKPAAS
ncbi:MAG: HAMP domain-containing histidine kinase [Alphaproteobacteria bacterium]|nr:HAMP domain-containing histidine kinase [Alphaproteobacteria bacterium]